MQLGTKRDKKNLKGSLWQKKRPERALSEGPQLSHHFSWQCNQRQEGAGQGGQAGGGGVAPNRGKGGQVYVRRRFLLGGLARWYRSTASSPRRSRPFATLAAASS
eukprot:EG_transcript_48539